MSKKSAGCIFYSPGREVLVCGLKNLRLEGFGGESKAGETMFQTAIRELLEEMVDIYESNFREWESELPKPRFIFVSRDGYINYVYTYEDYIIIAEVMHRHGVKIPSSISEVLLEQRGKEHDFITEISYNPDNIVMQRVKQFLIHDYFYKDILILNLVTREYRFPDLRVNLIEELHSLEFLFAVGNRTFRVKVEKLNTKDFVITEKLYKEPADLGVINKYLQIVLA